MKYFYINQMDSVPTDGTLQDFVINVHWSRLAKETINDVEYNASAIWTEEAIEAYELFKAQNNNYNG